MILSPAFCQVYWKISSGLAIFGQDTDITCYLEKISTHAEDCFVRKWSGGPKRSELVHNGISSDQNKYEERKNLQGYQFSLTVKKLEQSDINVNYTCSCGYPSFTKNLSLDENTFYYPPAGYQVKFSANKRFLRVNLSISQVYPVPNCSLYLEDRLISDQKGCTYKNNGIVYSVLYVAKYALEKNDCNKVPKVKCTFRNGVKPVLFKGNQTFKCAGDKLKVKYEDDSVVSKKLQTNHHMPVLVTICLFTPATFFFCLASIRFIYDFYHSVVNPLKLQK